MKKFPEALQALLNSAEHFDRKEWAKYLFASTKTIEDWIDEKDVPRPDHLFKILSYLDGFNNEKIIVAIINFHVMADLPIEEVISSKNVGQFKAKNIAEYVTKVVFPNNLAYELSKVPSKYRLKIIQFISEVVRVSNGILKEGGPDAARTQALILEGSTEKIKKMFQKA